MRKSQVCDIRHIRFPTEKSDIPAPARAALDNAWAIAYTRIRRATGERLRADVSIRGFNAPT